MIDANDQLSPYLGSTHPVLNGPDRVRVKICGITTQDQAQKIVDLGADALGFNFWPSSKRYLDPETTSSWMRELAGQVLRVAVTVNASDDELLRFYESGAVDLLQLHGDESLDRVRRLTQQGLPVFKAVGVKSRDSLEGLDQYPNGMLLLDAYSPVEHGGTGEVFDWRYGAEAVRRYRDHHIWLAGGLTPDNIAAAVTSVRPWGVDVASGVEESPGRKDLQKVAQFIEVVRSLPVLGAGEVV